ncbi:MULTISPECIES: thioredoxin [Haloferax]|uniref:Thioredoxin n=2 Tax=Haloferax TaxID=2251 RepID=A0A6G1Z425_9EURY|nr:MULTISPECIES: thioredoxin [Haloferax]KAB1188600.1 thioredoxin [Haloferax sp. CBA1149]MRW81300.1 thioredoxin [Haloferax marinisediminis]
MSTPTSTSAPIHVESSDHLDELIADNDIVLVDYHAEWCGPCKMLEPTVKEIADETAAIVAKVDIDELQELARDKQIRSVPTLQFYANGEKAHQVIGVQSKDDLVGIIEQLA